MTRSALRAGEPDLDAFGAARQPAIGRFARGGSKRARIITKLVLRFPKTLAILGPQLSLPANATPATLLPQGPDRAVSKPPPIAPGTVIADRYDVRQSLGKGGMGEVFMAFDRSTQLPVALKVVREESRMPGDDEALRQELLLARQVSHPNVCRVHDLAPSPWGPILVMEHISGQTLHTSVARRRRAGTPRTSFARSHRRWRRASPRSTSRASCTAT